MFALWLFLLFAPIASANDREKAPSHALHGTPRTAVNIAGSNPAG